MIEPLADKYGSFARASFFADYMELAALKSRRVKVESVRDLIGDTYPLLQQGFLDVGEEPSNDWKSTQLADEAWTSILERAEFLGDKYPFVPEDGVLRKVRDLDALASPYISLLSVTLAHAFGLFAHNHVENLMESIVADALEELGLTVSKLAQNSRGGSGDFSSALAHLASDIGIEASHNAVVRRVHANDEGVDIVAHADWGVRRNGRWIYIGQVTCAMSNEWRRKASEPVPADWQNLLAEIVVPVPFLAVPHHADGKLLSYVSSVGTLVLDRTRLASKLTDNSDEQRQVIDRVLSEDYQSFAV